MSIGVVVAKNDIFKQKIPECKQTIRSADGRSAYTKAWQAIAIDSVTINSTGYVKCQSSYSRPTADNDLYYMVSTLDNTDL